MKAGLFSLVLFGAVEVLLGGCATPIEKMTADERLTLKRRYQESGEGFKADLMYGELFELAKTHEKDGRPELAMPLYEELRTSSPDWFGIESSFRIIEYEIKTTNYVGAAEQINRMQIDYSGGPYQDRLCLLSVLVQYRMEDYERAAAVCRVLVLNFPGSSYSSTAKAILRKIESKLKDTSGDDGDLNIQQPTRNIQ